MSGSKLRALEPYARSILRVIAGYMVVAVGTHVVFGVPGAPRPQFPEESLAPALGQRAVIEVVGGALLILGLLTVPAALVLCLHMAFVYVTMFAPKSSPFLPIRNGGPFPMDFFFVFLLLFVAGAGPWSLDNAIARLWRRKGHT